MKSEVVEQSRSKQKMTTYQTLRSEVEKPFSERQALPIGRGDKMRTPRKHHLTADEKSKLIREAEALGRDCINPFRGRSGLYFGQVEALIQLGVNEWHSFKTVRDKIEEVLSAEKTKAGRSAWDNARNRKPKDTANAPQDINGRIKTNFKTLQRLPVNCDKNPYGIKLRQFGLCVDIEWRKANSLSAPVPYYRLNTNGLTLKGSLQAEDLIESGKLKVCPINHNPFSKRSRGKKEKSIDYSGKTGKSGENRSSR